MRMCIVGLLICASPTVQGFVGPGDHSGIARMSFYCNTGYAREACDAEVARLRQALGKFDLEQLGEWSWVLVRSDDWARILRGVGRDGDSPAFTILERRQTFLEEALFNRMAGRSQTLIEKWRVPLDQLLDLALAHELGHAICRERDEVRTHTYADQLLRSGRVTCRPKGDPVFTSGRAAPYWSGVPPTSGGAEPS